MYPPTQLTKIFNGRTALVVFLLVMRSCRRGPNMVMNKVIVFTQAGSAKRFDEWTIGGVWLLTLCRPASRHPFWRCCFSVGRGVGSWRPTHSVTGRAMVDCWRAGEMTGVVTDSNSDVHRPDTVADNADDSLLAQQVFPHGARMASTITIGLA